MLRLWNPLALIDLLLYLNEAMDVCATAEGNHRQFTPSLSQQSRQIPSPSRKIFINSHMVSFILAVMDPPPFLLRVQRLVPHSVTPGVIEPVSCDPNPLLDEGVGVGRWWR